MSFLAPDRKTFNKTVNATDTKLSVRKLFENFMFLQFIILDINMLFLPIICYQKRELKKSAFWFNMTHHNQKRDLWHISRTIVPQQLVFMKIKGQQIKALFFYFKNLKTELKNLFSNKMSGYLKILHKFSFA